MLLRDALIGVSAAGGGERESIPCARDLGFLTLIGHSAESASHCRLLSSRI
jgi:hypothetical protein